MSLALPTGTELRVAQVFLLCVCACVWQRWEMGGSGERTGDSFTMCYEPSGVCLALAALSALFSLLAGWLCFFLNGSVA